ncbi:MAG TPA: hypothetical protein VM778_11175 [Gemmatimonadota bacterium]|nr:hypothetical protein [Gemmatimonadota bacterium]
MVIGPGLILPRPESMPGGPLVADSVLAAALSPGYADRPDRLWRLAPDAPDWSAVQAQVLDRLTVSSYSREWVEELIDSTRSLQRAVDVARGDEGADAVAGNPAG